MIITFVLRFVVHLDPDHELLGRLGGINLGEEQLELICNTQEE